MELLGEASAATLMKRPTTNLTSYDLCLRGRHSAQELMEAGIRRSLDYFSQALAEAPDYAQAHAGLALAYALLRDFSFAGPREAMPKAAAVARRALPFDEGMADAHFALATVLDDYAWDWSAAEHEYHRALALNAGDAFVRFCYSGMLCKAGRTDDATAEATRVFAYERSAPSPASRRSSGAWTAPRRGSESDLDSATHRRRGATAVTGCWLGCYLKLQYALIRSIGVRLCRDCSAGL